MAASLPALADDANGGTSDTDKSECVRAYGAGQKLRRAGALVQARKEFRVCAQARCPQALVEDCTTWTVETDALIPSVLVTVRKGGREVIEAKVSLDGAAFLDRVDARAHDVEPGEHLFRAEVGGGAFSETRVLVREGEKRKVVELVIPEPPPTASPTPPLARKGGGPSFWAYGTSAVAVLSVGVGGYFGISGLSSRSDLENCSPACPQSRLDDVRQKFLFADVALGLGLLSAGIATYLWITETRTTSRGAGQSWGVHF